VRGMALLSVNDQAHVLVAKNDDEVQMIKVNSGHAIQ